MYYSSESLPLHPITTYTYFPWEGKFSGSSEDAQAFKLGFETRTCSPVIDIREFSTFNWSARPKQSPPTVLGSVY
jgi:hypothetical protein